MSQDENKGRPSDNAIELTDQQAENLRAAYKELCTSYHAIDDFRAKLLGLLPLATGTGIYLLLDKLKDAKTINSLEAQTKHLLAALGGFGFVTTLGLFLYEIYGIKKCCALIQAGTHMEGLLRVNDGQFQNRPQNVASVINEPSAAGVIYPAVLASWIYFALIFACPKANPWIPILVFIVGAACTLIYDFLLRRRIDQLGRCDKYSTRRAQSRLRTSRDKTSE
jgi:hypothetical protein